ncbi:DUF397 domain-containing protein [Streptomyces sp. 549]|uniref:DUF397 domain-containing protein n=1 Tax=Streptomyces sp. 549 TaxID=3049076 RepID=UPI0032E35A03
MSNWDALTWIRTSDDPAQECIEVAGGEGGLVHLRQTDNPEHVVTTTRAKWRAFVLGVRNNEFDHFVTGEDVESATGGGAWAATGHGAGAASGEHGEHEGEQPQRE